jgi:hypothetical protein
MSKHGFIIHELHREAWESLADEQCGKLLKVLIRYQFDMEIPLQMPPDLQMAFNFLRPVIDKQKADYEAKCEKAKEAATKRWDNANGCERIKSDADHGNRTDENGKESKGRK